MARVGGGRRRVRGGLWTPLIAGWFGVDVKVDAPDMAPSGLGACMACLCPLVAKTRYPRPLGCSLPAPCSLLPAPCSLLPAPLAWPAPSAPLAGRPRRGIAPCFLLAPFYATCCLHASAARRCSARRGIARRPAPGSAGDASCQHNQNTRSLRRDDRSSTARVQGAVRDHQAGYGCRAASMDPRNGRRGHRGCVHSG